ncbi:MAG: hypothetical protein Q8L24_02960 [bacterium]|nr:hypothetical protein [bacterium]
MIKNGQKGYIAIVSSVIISLVLMIVAISVGSSNLLSRGSVNDFQMKLLSHTIARSCLNHALYRLADSLAYTGNETVAVSSYSCALSTITTFGLNKVITAKASINGITTNLRLTANSRTLSTVSLEELQ